MTPRGEREASRVASSHWPSLAIVSVVSLSSFQACGSGFEPTAASTPAPTPTPGPAWNEVAHYRGRVHAWDVVNEAIDDAKPGLRSTVFSRGLGPEYVAMHLSAASLPAAADIRFNIQRLADLGLRVNISEMEVRVRDLSGDGAAKLERQRQVYHDVVAACVAVPRCEAVTFWGFTDAHTWIDAVFGPDDPLLFDEQYRAKPALFGVEDALLALTSAHRRPRAENISAVV